MKPIKFEFKLLCLCDSETNQLGNLGKINSYFRKEYFVYTNKVMINIYYNKEDKIFENNYNNDLNIRDDNNKFNREVR